MTVFEKYRGRSVDQDGFSLIEMLVVVIIIGILAGIAIAIFMSQQHKAYVSAMTSDLRTTADELEGYYSTQESYPSWLDGQTLSGNVWVDDELLKLTSGDTVRVDYNSDASAYCLTAANSHVDEHRYYVSDRGGLQSTATTGCGSF